MCDDTDLSDKELEKTQTGSGLTYYVNHKERLTQWEHPIYQAALVKLRNCDNIKYAAYRTAAKLGILQKTLALDRIRLGLVAGVFERHRLRATENSLLLESTELAAVLSDIFFAASRESAASDLDVDLSAELTLNFLLSIYDKEHRSHIGVLSAKTCLVTLCRCRLQDKYKYLFAQLADHNCCLSRRRLQLLLESLMAIITYLSETQAFSPQLIPATLDSCFQQSHGPLGISEEGFTSWLQREPQLLVWLSTFYRMKAAETVSHRVRCAVCRTHPIRGLRYCCLRCLGYDQCQVCFFTGRTSKRHSLRHPMQEYCCQTTPRESTLAFVKALVNRLCGNTSRLQYLPAERACSNLESFRQTITGSGEDLISAAGVEPNHLLTIEKHRQKKEPNALHNTQQELQSIIALLEWENMKLEELCSGVEGGRWIEHRALMEQQIDRLKQLKNDLLKIHGSERRMERMQSTPVVRYTAMGNSTASTHSLFLHEDVSPIVYHSLASPSSADQGLPLRDVTPGQISTWFGEGQPSPAAARSGFDTWLHGQPFNGTLSPAPSDKTDIEELHSDLDNILEKLQKMLTTSFSTAIEPPSYI